MDSAFSITTTTNAIVLDAAGRSAAVFTVNNQTGRSVRVRTDVSAFPPTPAAWFTIDGASERLYPPGGAEAVTVLVAAGAPAPPGQYAFRLDAVSVDRPDEEWGHGPSVGFEVTTPKPPPPPPPPKERRGYLETVLGAIAGTALMIVVTMIIAAIVALTAFNAFPGLAGIIFRLELLDRADDRLCPRRRGRCGRRTRRAWDRRCCSRGGQGSRSRSSATAILTVFQVALALSFLTQPNDAGKIALNIIGTLVLIVPAALAGRAYARLPVRR